MKQPQTQVLDAAHLSDHNHAKLSLRERKKAEKLQLIKQAARELFFTKGYEATTMREVAAHADVGFGTVSSYTTDKAGLLAMLFVDDLDSLPPLFQTLEPHTSLLDQLVSAFTQLYEFWAINPALSRIVLPQMEFYNSNPYTDIILQRRRQLQRQLTLWLDQWQAQKRIPPELDTQQISLTIFAIYTSALREWVTGDELNLTEGQAKLRYMLAIPARLLESAYDYSE